MAESVLHKLRFWPIDCRQITTVDSHKKWSHFNHCDQNHNNVKARNLQKTEEWTKLYGTLSFISSLRELNITLSKIFISPHEVYICICYIIKTQDRRIHTTIPLYNSLWFICSIIFVPFESILLKFRLISNKNKQRKNKQHVRQWGRGESVRYIPDEVPLNNIR